MEIHVRNENFYRRLDKFLRRNLPDVPLSAIYKFIRKGKVFVNGKRVRKIDHELNLGDEVEIRNVDLKSYRKSRENLVPQRMDLEIIHEDDWLLVLNKPPGIALHPGRGIHLTTLIEGLIFYGNEKGFKPHLVHRLDLNTSGVLIVAKDKDTSRTLTEFFKRRLVKKRYLTLVKGRVVREGKIDLDLDGQSALTFYRPLEVFKDVSLLAVEMSTGRKHQIRRHMAMIRHPVVGDNKYGDRRFNAEFRKIYGLKRQFLHCFEIELPHPATDERMRFEAKIWEDLMRVLERLRV